MHLSYIASHIASDKKPLAAFFQSGKISLAELTVYERIMGLKSVPRENKFTIYDQIKIVMTKLCDEYCFLENKIKYVFFSHTANIVFPFGFNGLKKIVAEFGLTKSVCFGTTLHKCAATFQLIQLSKQLFQSLNDDDCILIITADCAFTEILHIIPGTTILGDAATAIILKKKDAAHKLIDVQIKSHGEFAKGIWADETEKKLFQENYIKYLSELIIHTVQKNNISIERIKCIFPHNVNLISWRQVMQTLSLRPDQIYLTNIKKTAHCFGSDPFFNLTDGIAEKRIMSGDYYLLVTMGLGATFGVMMLRF